VQRWTVQDKNMDFHKEADILEVIFSKEEANAAVRLTPDIILHFRAENQRATSLIINNFTHLSQPDRHGPRAFRLQAEKWPEALRNKIWQIIASPPVSEWLTISSYQPQKIRPAIALATVHSHSMQTH